jgi:hypothetical protein
MHESGERIQRLEQSVRRWRLVSLCLALLLLCSHAIGGTLVGLLFVNLPDQGNALMMPWARERAARQAAEMARQEALRARQAADAARQAAEAAKVRENQEP